MIRALVATALVAAIAAQATAADKTSWRIEGSAAAPPFVLVLPLAPDARKRGYFFDCSAKSRVKITQTGVTDLLKGAAPLMALSIDEVPPNLVVASSVPNPAGGEDLTIEIDKTDKAFVGMPKAKLVALFSTGHTIAVVLDEADRAVIGDFVQQCLAIDAR